MRTVRRNSHNTHQPEQFDPQSALNDQQQSSPSRTHSRIGELASKEVYLSTLQQEIQKLRERITKMEEEEGEKQRKTLLYRQQDRQQSDISQEGQSRKSQAGRIYIRTSTPSASKKTPKLTNKEESSFYKWRPRIQDRAVSAFQEDEEEAFSPEIKNKSLSHYRVRQKTKSIAEQRKLSTKEEETEAKQKFKTEKLISQNKEEKERNSKKGQSTHTKSHPQESNDPQQLKKVFISNPAWEITSINDDFRQKILSKIQIPPGFPLIPPSPTLTIEELQKKSQQIYKIFGIDISRCKQAVIVRKFKNGVYYQLKPDKNIVWYFNGAFYFGEWDTDLPSEAEKDGFGFQYIPDKYYYLGHFKDGTRNGMGTIQIINPSSPKEFLAYDGCWLDGLPHGEGKHIDQKGNKYIGSFELGEKTGRAVVLNVDGLYYEGDLKKGLKNGHGTERLTNGDVYEGNFLQGLFSGMGKYTWKNGSIYEGEFLEGKRQGKGVWRAYNGDKFEGTYSKDLKNGWGKFSWKNGEIYQGEFKDDIRNGVGSYKHPNGKIGTYFWIDGHIDHKIQSQAQALSKMKQPSHPQSQQQPPSFSQSSQSSPIPPSPLSSS